MIKYPGQEWNEVFLDVLANSGEDPQERRQRMTRLCLTLRQQYINNGLPMQNNQLQRVHVVVDSMRGFEPFAGSIGLAPKRNFFLRERRMAASWRIPHGACRPRPIDVYLNRIGLMSVMLLCGSGSSVIASLHAGLSLFKRRLSTPAIRTPMQQQCEYVVT